jgi:adenylate cyclase
MLVGYIQLIQRNHDEAIRYGQKAVSLNPNDPILIAILAMIMDYSGRFEEAITLFKKAKRLTPYYPAFIPDHLCSAYITAGRYAEAVETGELALERSRKGELNPLPVHRHLAAAYAGLGQEDEARAHAAEVLKIDPNFSLNHHKKMLPYKNPAHSKSLITLYRKAGLPE